MTNRRVVSWITIVIVGICLFNPALYSIGLDLSGKEISTTGKGSIISGFIKNSTDQALPIEITVKRFNIDINGKEILTDIGKNEFFFSPARLLLRPNEKQAFTMRWIGEKSIDQEQVYWLSLDEVPIKTDKDKSSPIQFTVKTSVIQYIYVKPENPRSELAIESVMVTQSVEATQNIKMLEFIVANKGNTHIRPAEILVEINDEKLSKPIQINLIGRDIEFLPAGSKRRLLRPLPNTAISKPIAKLIQSKSSI